jgi:hypothetical protein
MIRFLPVLFGTTLEYLFVSGFGCVYECSRIEKVQVTFPGHPYLVTFPKIDPRAYGKWNLNIRKDKLINKYYARVNAVMLYIGDGRSCGGWNVRIVIMQGK